MPWAARRFRRNARDRKGRQALLPHRKTQKQPVRLDELLSNGCGDGICLPRKTGFAGAPLHLTASVAGKAGSLRHCGGTRRRCGSNPTMLCGKTQKQPVRLDELFSNGCGDEICLPRKTGFAGAPLHLTASVAAQSGSLLIAGVSAETPLRHRKAGRARSDGRNHVPPVNPLLFGRGQGN